VDKIGERAGCRFRPSSAQPSKAREHGLILSEADITNLAAVAAVPAQSGPLESEVSASSRSRRSSRGVSYPTCSRSAA
jgi:hypothetical protein